MLAYAYALWDWSQRLRDLTFSSAAFFRDVC
jgi:hypothetical protein